MREGAVLAFLPFWLNLDFHAQEEKMAPTRMMPKCWHLSLVFDVQGAVVVRIRTVARTLLDADTYHTGGHLVDI